MLTVCSAFRRLGEDYLLQLLRSSISGDRLNLANQNIGDDDFLFVIEFASALRPSITSLQLDNNDLACPEVEKASFPPTLERLKLDGNRRLTPIAAVGVYTCASVAQTIYVTATFATQTFCSALLSSAHA
jgi:hypothetical protein